MKIGHPATGVRFFFLTEAVSDFFWGVVDGVGGLRTGNGYLFMRGINIVEYPQSAKLF